MPKDIWSRTWQSGEVWLLKWLHKRWQIAEKTSGRTEKVLGGLWTLTRERALVETWYFSTSVLITISKGAVILLFIIRTKQKLSLFTFSFESWMVFWCTTRVTIRRVLCPCQRDVVAALPHNCQEQLCFELRSVGPETRGVFTSGPSWIRSRCRGDWWKWTSVIPLAINLYYLAGRNSVFLLS